MPHAGDASRVGAVCVPITQHAVESEGCRRDRTQVRQIGAVRADSGYVFSEEAEDAEP